MLSRMLKGCFWLGSLLGLLALCLQAQTIDPAQAKKAGMDPALLAKIKVRMQDFVDKGQIAGAVTLVARHGVVVRQEAVGLQELAPPKLMKIDSIFQIMSMTKPVTGVGIMMLVEEGRLGLNDPVEQYLPEFKGQWMVAGRRLWLDVGSGERAGGDTAIQVDRHLWPWRGFWHRRLA